MSVKQKQKHSNREIEILVSELNILNSALTPPFTIEDETDGGEDIRMKYRYLDIRRNPVKTAYYSVTKWQWKFVNIYQIWISAKWKHLI